MRDNNEGMPEIIDAFKENDCYFGVVAITVNDLTKKFRFGLSKQNYLTIRRILQFRPFDKLGGLRYRYFFSGGSYRLINTETLELGDCEITIRIEQNKNGKEFTFPATKELMQNLSWANQIKDFKEAEHLPEVK